MERGDALIRLEAIHKHYALEGVDVHALRGVDLSVAPGEFLAIMGPSGSGKSTLMNIIGCLDLPDSGSFHLRNALVSRLDPDGLAALRNREIGFVFQGFNLLPRTSALENVETPLIYAGLSRRERRRRAKEMLVRVGLGDRLLHQPSQLSGGEQQRVAVARALVNHPQLLLADEPTGNLDTETSREILSLLEELNREDGITIVVITHDAEVAQSAERRLHLRDGKVQD